MNNLEMLLKEEQDIKAKVVGAFNTVVAWFEKKIDYVKGQFAQAKSKVLETIKKDKSKGNEAKNLFSKVKSAGENVIAHCKKGISAAKSKNSDGIKTEKEKVVSGLSILKQALIRVGAVAAGMAAAGAAGNMMAKKAIDRLEKEE